MSNVARHRKRAVEFEQSKQFDKAISAYIRAIEEAEAEGEEVDVALYNKVGDLTLRMGRVPDAVTYYERAVERYTAVGLFNNAIALCNKILRNAPGRSAVYFTLGRICAKKGMRGDASRNFLEYATRMRGENRTDEAMRALAEVAEMMPELSEIRGMVEDYAARAGIALRRKETPSSTDAAAGDRSRDLVFLDIGSELPFEQPKFTDAVAAGLESARHNANGAAAPSATSNRTAPLGSAPARMGSDGSAASFADALIFDPSDIVDDDDSDSAGFESVEINDQNAVRGESVSSQSTDSVESQENESGDSQVPSSIDYLGTIDFSSPVPDLLVTGEFRVPESNVVEGLTGIEPEAEAPVPLEQPPLGELTSNQGTIEVELSSDVQDNANYCVPTEDDVEHDIDVIENIEHAEQVNDELAMEHELVAELRASREVVAIAESSSSDVVGASVEAIASDEATASVAAAAIVRDSNNANVIQDIESESAIVQSSAAPMRINPHDFILPSELPPLLIPDGLLRGTVAAVVSGSGEDRSDVVADQVAEVEIAGYDIVDITADVDIADVHVTDVDIADVDVTDIDVADIDVTDIDVTDNTASIDVTNSSIKDLASHVAGTDTAAVEASVANEGVSDVEVEVDIVEEEVAAVEAVEAEIDLYEDDVAAESATSPLPNATALAEARHAAFEEAVKIAPHDWGLRHRYAESLLEIGRREEGISELEHVLSGFAQSGDRLSAYDIASQLVLVGEHRIRHHQKRVELAVRLDEPQRLRESYLDLADALVRTGEDGRAHAVYARVLELDPRDERARMALGAAAPPLPEEPQEQPYVDLASWLRDDDQSSTRMRMHEPTITGDEQADFDSLLRHFKEGVARSIGDDDHDSHYDLGVAYKEMGLLDDAIAEFQKALRSRVHRLPAYEALGQCFVEQGRHQVAVTVLSRALHEPGLGDEQRIGVLYLLGYALHILQRFDESRSYFQRVYATDKNFRDVAARLAAIDQVAQ